MDRDLLIDRARQLRKNMTRQERHLWYDFLCSYPVKFRRQYIIGPFIVDFYCSQARLAIELDGSQHYSDQGIADDRSRTEALSKRGVVVARYANNEVDRNFAGVCADIDRRVKELMR